ncbi:putative nucleotidyltransferase substrate binding domain-containing protein [Rhodococcus sp. NPDC056960]|uniref:putative nucleotidyltransferase substrate binding domain-containing protein n=1 Tax=Rhodococcus sp. NPDC056960 TaxID=3345982 RepID=UPI00363A15B0
MTETLPEQLARCQPLNALPPDVLATAAAAATVDVFEPGAIIMDAFAEPASEIRAILTGDVAIWHDPHRVNEAAQARFTVGDLFGFSAALTESPVGPKAVAITNATVARIPWNLVATAFTSPTGARFLAGHVSQAYLRPNDPPSYLVVDDLIGMAPVVVRPSTPAAEVARQITEQSWPCAVVQTDHNGYGLITEAALLRKVVVEGLPPSTPASDLMVYPAPTIVSGESTTDAIAQLIDTDEQFLLVVDRGGSLRGVLDASDFVAAPSTAGVSLHGLIRRSADIDTLIQRSRRVPTMLDDLLARGLASARVIAAYSGVIDSIIRRAIVLVFAQHTELSVDAFTWLSLGSNGRREAVLSSDVDAAVAFDDALDETEQDRYRTVFREVIETIKCAGLTIDGHGATPSRPAFSRTNSQWRTAGRRWLARANEDEGAIMGSLLVDARPIHGDPGLPEVTRVFGNFRRHPATMQLLLDESLSHRAKLHSIRAVLGRRTDRVDIKSQALLPLVNIARWAALGVGSTELLTTARLRAAAGSEFLPERQANQLIEVFDVLQRLRLRYQIAQIQEGISANDIFERRRLSRIDHSVVSQAIRQIAEVQRRMDRVAETIPVQKLAARVDKM